MFEESLGRSPLCLTIPGLGNSGPGHWQSIWEAERSDCERIDLGLWDEPIRNVWISRIDQAVGQASAPPVLVAHSLGCLTLVWWASFVGEPAAHAVRGALLVAPPDVEHPAAGPHLTRFAPPPKLPLPFPAILVASRNDPYAAIERAAEMASDWLCEFTDIGEAGHINASSGLGAWSEGQALLERLIDAPPRRAVVATPRASLKPAPLAAPLR